MVVVVTILCSSGRDGDTSGHIGGSGGDDSGDGSRR